MNALVVASCGAAGAVAFWFVARAAAARRRLALGALPGRLPVLAAAAAALAAAGGAHAPAIVACAGVAVAAWVDARTGSIFDPLTAALAASALALAALDGVLLDGVCGAATIGAALGLIRALSGGRGLGLGDVKLGAAVGVALGVSAGLIAIGLAFIFGAGYGVWLIVTRRATAQSAIRFGPFIAAGTFAALGLPLVLRP